MSSNFTHKPLGDDPKEWKYEIGLLPASTNVVFSLESLLQFLKSLNIEVSPNYTELKSLPKYAQFGKMDAAQHVADTSSQSTATTSPVVTPQQPIQQQSVHLHQHQDQTHTAPSPAGSAGQAIASAPLVSPIEGFVPTRKVRQEIGGGSRAIAAALFGDDDEAEPVPARPVNPTPVAAASAHHEVPQDNGTLTSPIPGFVPTRRVRQLIGKVPPSLWVHDAAADALTGGGSAGVAAIFS